MKRARTPQRAASEARLRMAPRSVAEALAMVARSDYPGRSMSTDVYIDVGTDGPEHALRVGHHALMALYDPSLLVGLRVLELARPCLDEWVIGLVGDLFDATRRGLDELRASGATDWIARMGPDDGHDRTVLAGGEVVAFLRAHVGSSWHVRVD